jgi:uncharacterized protein YndB with AHSA1/START domain
MVTLTVRRAIRASPDRLFRAWTTPEQLLLWWGPTGVACIGAQVDLRLGGHYRIGNRLPDGQTIWIAGDFEVVEPPNRLTYTWHLEGTEQLPERVTVQFEPMGELTDVVVTHERIATRPLRDQHEQGWQGCLDGLARYVTGDQAEAAGTGS